MNFKLFKFYKEKLFNTFGIYIHDGPFYPDFQSSRLFDLILYIIFGGTGI